MKPFPLLQTNKLLLGSSGVYSSKSQAIEYSEGTEAEEYLRKVFSESEDLSSHSIELERNIKDWSSEYHLTSARANILRCLNLEGIRSALELGCGCGSITRYLGEIGIEVDAIEGGAARAELARMRCKGLDNVNIILANFNELEFPENSYDAIFMIGVIEYAAMFSPDQSDDKAAIADIFSRIRPSLKPGGVLVLALENRMGLKYFYGAGEDHLATPYVGIYDYPGKQGVRSYSKSEWGHILRDNQWQHARFLFPFPDYKIPRVILSDNFTQNNPYAHSLLYRIESRDYLSSWSPEANEYLSWKGINKSGLLQELANSFLIVASGEEGSLSRCVDKDFVHYSSAGRQPAFRTATFKAASDNRIVKKRICSAEPEGNLVSQKLSTTSYIKGELLITSWVECLVSDNPFGSLTTCLQNYYRYLSEYSTEEDIGSDIIELIPSNIVVDELTGTWKVFDLEWVTKRPVSIDFIFFRALFWFVHHNRDMVIKVFHDRDLENIDTFISLFFAELGLQYGRNRLHFIDHEQQLHEGVISTSGQPIDVSYMLSMPFKNTQDFQHTEAISAPEEKIKKRSARELAVAISKRCIKSVRSYLLSSQCRKIRWSRLFDAQFYCRTDKALQDLSVDPLLHYVETGFREGRDPSPMFSLDYYKKIYPDLQTTSVDPLIHYLKTGRKEDAVTHPLLEQFVLAPGSLWKKARLEERKNKTKKNQHTPSYFNAAFYCKKYPDIKSDNILPVMHYLYHGGVERRQPGPFFDPQWYTERTPFYDQERGDLLDHYLKTGASVNKSPIPVFDPEYYLQHIEGIGAKDGDIFGHYMKHGLQHDRKPCSWFDPQYYRSSCKDLSPYNFPLDHYLYRGVHEKVYVNKKVAELSQKPLISILVPVYNVSQAYLNCCVRSVLYQSYPHWELCLVDDGSSDVHVKPLLQQWSSKDERIKVRFLGRNQGISKASNAAAEMATGDFFAFLDNDDELNNEALFCMVKRVCDTGADLLYSDENLIGDDGRQLSVFYKPDFNKELLYSHNYITHLVVTQRELFFSVGGFNSLSSGAQDYDLFLKLSEKAKIIEHVPKVLYHWRASQSSTSINHEQKEYAHEAGKIALEEMLKRQKKQGDVCATKWKFFYRIKRKIEDFPKVSIIVLGRSDARFMTWIKELNSFSAYQFLEFVICCDESQITSFTEQLNDIEDLKRIKLLQVKSVSARAQCYNYAVRNCEGRHVVFIDSHIRVKNSDWLEALLEYSWEDTIGLVGGRITPLSGEENFTIPDISQDSPLYYLKFIQQCSRHLNSLECAQDVSMMSCHFTMISKDVFQEVGGFDEESSFQLFDDSDLSLRLVKSGYLNVYTPYANGSFLVDDSEIYNIKNTDEFRQEQQLFQKYWRDFLVKGDPHYNIEVVSSSGVNKESFVKWYAGNSGVG